MLAKEEEDEADEARAGWSFLHHRASLLIQRCTCYAYAGYAVGLLRRVGVVVES
jgi:hypothetical protein